MLGLQGMSLCWESMERLRHSSCSPWEAAGASPANFGYYSVTAESEIITVGMRSQPNEQQQSLLWLGMFLRSVLSHILLWIPILSDLHWWDFEAIKQIVKCLILSVPEFPACKIEKETKRENNSWVWELFGQGLHALYVYIWPSGSFISLDYFHVTRMHIIINSSWPCCFYAIDQPIWLKS